MSVSPIRVYKKYDVRTNPLVTVGIGRIRFSTSAANKYNIFDKKHAELFVDRDNKLLGVKFLEEGNDEQHFRLVSVYPNKSSKNPLVSFAANPVLRSLGVDPRTTQHYQVVDSQTPGVDLWIKFDEKTDAYAEVKKEEIAAAPEEFQKDILSSGFRFKKHIPQVISNSRISSEFSSSEPLIRVTKNFINFNLAAVTRFNLRKMKSVEVFVDDNTKHLGFKFHDEKIPSSYKLTHHKSNKSVLFSWYGVASRLGIPVGKTEKRGRPHGLQASSYVRLLTPPEGETLDCIVDMTQIIQKVGAIRETVKTTMKPIKALRAVS